MSTVDIPGVGPVDKRVAIGIGVATVGAIGYVYWRRSQAPAGEEVPSEFDEGGLLDTGEYGGGTGWAYAPTGGAEVPDGSADGIPRTNGEWTQAAVAYLESVGRDASAAADALGAYLAGEKLTAAQAVIVRTALGGVGSPPSGSHSIVVDGATPSTPAASKPGKPVPGIRSASTSSLTVGWGAVPGATSYEIKPPNGAATTQPGTSITIGGLKKGIRYTIYVTAINAAGRGPQSSVTGRTATK